MTILFLDTETFCETPLKHGVHRYAETVEITVVSWAEDDGPVFVEDLTLNPELPPRLRQLLEDPEVLIVIQNSGFDRTVIRHAWGIDIDPGRIHDTMVQALSHGLPGGLDALCTVMSIPTDQAKDKAGKALIQLFCKPRPVNAKVRRADRRTHPVEWARFLGYAGSDILAMRALFHKLPKWNYDRDAQSNAAVTGHELWQLDQKINDRGVAVDTELAEAAVAAVKIAQQKLKDRVWGLTAGEVASAAKRDQLLKYILAEYGIELPDMKAATLERRLADPDLDEGVKELIRIRLASSTTSTTKYAALLRGVSSDGRLRGTLQFCGASRTGRWAGRLFQPQNMPRPDMKAEDIELGIDALKLGCADLTDNVMKMTSNAIRGCLVAPPGKKLVIADLANIEGRVAAWLSGEDWKLQAFRDYDAGTGADLYRLAYAKSFNIRPENVDGKQRQIGKVQELALGYEGGVGAFVTFVMTYKLDLDEMAEAAWDTLPGQALHQAKIMLAWRRKKGLTTYGLDDKVFIVCEAFKALWREAHPETSSYWKELNDAAIRAVENPGVTIVCRRLKFRRDGAWLRMGLPSGRVLCYAAPEIKNGSLTYMGLNQYTRKWGRQHTYGGKVFENACQGVARDVMADRMPLIDSLGYEIVTTIHDELVCETPDDDLFTSERLSVLMATNPSWAEGLPLAAAGFETKRYRKD